MKKAYIGSDFDSFLQQDGLLAECEAGALRRVVTWQITQEMKRRRISRAKLASRLKTSRSRLDRVFADDETPVTLQFLERAGLALGRRLEVELAWRRLGERLRTGSGISGNGEQVQGNVEGRCLGGNIRKNLTL